MKKKLLFTTMMVAACLGGCTSNKATVKETETAVESSAQEILDSTMETNGNETETSLEEITNESSEEKELIPSYGYYIESNKQKNGDTEWIELTFKGVDGQEFIATVNENTIVDDLEKDSLYCVYHSEVMTMSIPPIYPDVDSILRTDDIPETELETQNDAESASEETAMETTEDESPEATEEEYEETASETKAE